MKLPDNVRKNLSIATLIASVVILFIGNLHVALVAWTSFLFLGTTSENMRKGVETPWANYTSIASLFSGGIIFGLAIWRQDLVLVVFGILSLASASVFVIREKKTLIAYRKEKGPLE